MVGTDAEPNAGEAATQQNEDDSNVLTEVPWTRGDRDGWWGRDWWGDRRGSDATTNDSFGFGRWATPERQESSDSSTQSDASWERSWWGNHGWWGTYDGRWSDRREWGQWWPETIHEEGYYGNGPRHSDHGQADGAGGSTTYSHPTTTRSGWSSTWSSAGDGKGPSEKLMIPSFSGEGDGSELGSSARSYLRQVTAWEKMTKLSKGQRALVLYQNLQGAAWINAESLDVNKLGSDSGVEYLRDWIRQHYLDVEVTLVGRSLSDLFRRLKRRSGQTLRDYAAEFNRLLSRVRECGCELPDVATAWLFVDRADLDEATEVSLLASVGNKYALLPLQQAAIILDRSMRKPWERGPGGKRPHTAHMTEDANEGEEPEQENLDEDEIDEEVYVAYLTAKARGREHFRSRGADTELAKKTMEEKIRQAKAKSHCAACGQRGHWHKDSICPKNKKENGSTRPTEATRPNTIHVTSEIFELATDPKRELMAITDTACSKSVMGAQWLQVYLDMTAGKGIDLDFIYETESFRFGASRVYESHYAAVVLLPLGNGWVALKAAVVQGEVPLLISRPALASLGMVMDVADNTADFKAVGVKQLKLENTASGHPALPVCHKNRSLPDVSSLPKAWGSDEVKILSDGAAYMSFVAVWQMKKVELQAEMFRRGLTCNPSWTAVELRTILTEDSAKKGTHSGQTGTPKGMTSMSLAELRNEAERLGIELGAKDTRGMIMLKIRDTTAPENTIMTLGRFKGTAYKDVPENYANWASREADVNADNMHPDLRRFVTWWRDSKVKEEKEETVKYDPEANTKIPPPPISETGSSTAWSMVTPSRGYSSTPVLPGALAKSKAKGSRRRADEAGPSRMEQDIPDDIIDEFEETSGDSDGVAGDDESDEVGGYEDSADYPINDIPEEIRIENNDKDHGAIESTIQSDGDYSTGEVPKEVQIENSDKDHGTIEGTIQSDGDYLTGEVPKEVQIKDSDKDHGTIEGTIQSDGDYPTGEVPKEVQIKDSDKDHGTIEGTIQSDEYYPIDSVQKVAHSRDDGSFVSFMTTWTHGQESGDYAVPTTTLATDGDHTIRGMEASDDTHHEHYESCNSEIPIEEDAGARDDELANTHLMDNYLTGNNSSKNLGELLAKAAMDEGDYSDATLQKILGKSELRDTYERRQRLHGNGPVERYVFGYYSHGPYHGVCKRTLEHPNLVKYINNFIHDRWGAISDRGPTWSSFGILHNAKCEIHADRNNLAGSHNFCYGFGNYVGGGLWIAEPQGGQWRRLPNGEEVEGQIHDIKRNGAEFDPRRQHGPEVWKGDRWTISAYTTRSIGGRSEKEARILGQLGFNLPRRSKAKQTTPARAGRLPKKSQRRSMWKQAGSLSALFTVLATALSGGINPDPAPAQRSTVSLLEIGGVDVTCEMADYQNDNFTAAEPILWHDIGVVDSYGRSPSDLREAGEYLAQLQPRELWIHQNADGETEKQQVVNLYIRAQLARGGCVMIEGHEPELIGDGCVRELQARTDEYEIDVIDDLRPRPVLYIRPRTTGPEEAYVAEAGEPDMIPGARGIRFGKDVPNRVAEALRRLHQNLGHPSVSDLVRHLRLAGANKEILKAARTLECDTCRRTKQPDIPRPATTSNVLQFNQVVGIDLIYVHDSEGKKHELLSMVDYSSSYHIVVPVPKKDTLALENAYCEGWLNHYGPPGTVTIDLENGLQKGLTRACDWTGTAVKSCAGQAHWQAGFTERQGGAWKSIFNRVCEEHSVTTAEMKLAIAATSQAKNSLKKVGGYTPSQHVFGTLPMIPEDLLDGPHAQRPGEDVIYDDKHAREVAIRTAARSAFHQVQTDERVRRALTGRSRVTKAKPLIGDHVFFWRKLKNGKRGLWKGPATVIGYEGQNIWLTKGGRCFLCAPEHVRSATGEELGTIFTLRAARDDLDKLLEADQDDEEVYDDMDVEPGDGDVEGELPGPDPVLYDGHDGDEIGTDIELVLDEEEEDKRGQRRDGRWPIPRVNKRHRRKGPPDETHDVNMLKRATTQRSREKQMEKEISWKDIPEDMRSAFHDAEAKQWQEHMDHKALEILSLQESEDTRQRVPKDRILPSRYAYRDKNMGKRRANPEVPWRPKARLVIGGHLDPDLGCGRLSVDSPTVARSSLMLLLQICISRFWLAAAGDIQAAFLNGLQVAREIYMEQPRGGVPGLHPRQLLRVRKGIFGLSESPKMWFERLREVLTEEVFQINGEPHRLRQSPMDVCVFMLQREEGDQTPLAYIAIHVDDMLIVASEEVNRQLQRAISGLFPVDTWEENEFDYVGSHIKVEPDKIVIHQENFVEGRLFRVDVKPGQQDDEPADEEQLVDNRSLVGALSWLAGQTRPDLQCGVALAQQVQRTATVGDIKFSNSLVKKAEADKDKGVILRPIDLDQAMFITYHDAGWANAYLEEAEEGFQLTPEEIECGNMKEGPFADKERKARRTRSKVASQIGHVIILADRRQGHGLIEPSLLEWRSQACQRVCRSTFGAETMACVEGLENMQYIRSALLTFLTGSLATVIEASRKWPLLCLSDCKSLHDHIHRTGMPRIPADRRLAIDLTALRQGLTAERKHAQLPLQWVPTTAQVADPLTKPMKAEGWWSYFTRGIELPLHVDTLTKIFGECKTSVKVKLDSTVRGVSARPT
ncbi:RE1 [Symbiodinium sp. CCMP2592]|nr:RE1 [Symbiodinium sp. CCMP2592]